MPRGGARNGRPGQAYQNRSDLAIPKVVPGQQYGQGVAQQAVAQAMPRSDSAPAPVPPPGPAPGSLGPLTRPTERPDEPLTAGAPIGPGPNSIAGMPISPEEQADPMGKSLSMLYQALASKQTNPRLVDAQMARFLRLSFDKRS